MIWPPLRLLSERAPEYVWSSCRSLREWAVVESGSLECARWAQEVLDGVLRYKARDALMIHWASQPGFETVAALADEPLEEVFAELSAMNDHLLRLGLSAPLDVTPLLWDGDIVDPAT